MRVAARILLMAAAGLALAACNGPQARKEEKGVSVEQFGKLPTGEPVELYTLTNAGGIEARIMNYGASIVSLKTPDRDGNVRDVILGFDSLDGYLGTHPYFGSIVGRYANRIAQARFTLDGTVHVLAANNGPNSLHGGLRGFDKALWSASAQDGNVTFTHTSADGDEGYPGTLTAKVTYSLTPDNGLRIDYEARTDKPTVVNLSSHAYFNLADGGATTILGHEMMIHAGRFTPVDKTLIPTGELRPVDSTPFDFREPTRIGARIEADDQQLRLGGGYDHNFALDRTGSGVSLAARVHEPSSGRLMEVLTTEPGLQFYTGNFLNGTLQGKGGLSYQRRAGFCLETQHFPDSPNQPSFPSTLLRPGETYRSTTIYRFSAR